MMKSKPLRVLFIYYIFLAVSSLIFSLLGLKAFNFTYGGGVTEFNPMWFPTIIGGLIALKLTIPAKSFNFFVVIYFTLWIVRFVLLYFANRIGVRTIGSRTFHFDLIIYNYYRNVSRIDTHLPFVLYWFINYLFAMIVQQQNKKQASEEK